MTTVTTAQPAQSAFFPHLVSPYRLLRDRMTIAARESPRQRQEPVMPIEVHCPNPQCAKVHLVKDKYAGMRGKCPACTSWMYIPRVAAPTMLAHRPEAVAEAARRSPEPVSDARPVREEWAHPGRKESAEEKEALSVDTHEAPAWPDDGVQVAEDAEEKPVEVQPDTEKPKRKFSWLVALLLLLGMGSLGAVAACPYL